MFEAKIVQDFVEDIINSFEARIQGVETMVDATRQLFQGNQGETLDADRDRERINSQLRETLARNESLRKKDFDKMMKGITSRQEEREREVGDLLSSYLNEQRELAEGLRKSLEEFKRLLAVGEKERVRNFQGMIKELLAKQDERKEEVVSKLKEFREERQETAERLRGLLAKGRELRIRDLKSMLSEFRSQRSNFRKAKPDSPEAVHIDVKGYRSRD